MKSMILGVFWALVVVAGIAAAGRADAATCVGGSAMHGHYGFMVNGSSLTSGYGKYLTGSLYFNGVCGLSARNVNGGINQETKNSTASGTYAVTPDNVLTMTLRPAGDTTVQTYTLGRSVASGGASGLETDTTAVATISLQPQGPPPGGFTTASLSGTYQLSCIGQAESLSDLNTMSFDGAGNLTGTDVYNNEGDQGTAPITGTYQVESDGTFAAQLSNNFTGYSLTGVLIRQGHGMFYSYSVANTGGVVACTGAN